LFALHGKFGRIKFWDSGTAKSDHGEDFEKSQKRENFGNVFLRELGKSEIVTGVFQNPIQMTFERRQKRFGHNMSSIEKPRKKSVSSTCSQISSKKVGGGALPRGIAPGQSGISLFIFITSIN
jgi:hypothetical protein